MATAVAAVAAVAVAGCGLRPGDRDGEVTTALAPEGMALAAIGYDPYDLAVSDPLAVTEPYPEGWRRGWGRRHGGPGAIMRENMLHGEMVVETSDGPSTMLVQRGTVTELSDVEVTVTSTDGFAQTWTFDEDLRVVESRTEVELERLEADAEIGIAGHEDGSPVASLIVITG